MSILKNRFRVFRSLAAAALLGSLWSTPAEASPVMFAGAGSEKVHSTTITMMQKDGITVFSVLPDYQGPLRPFAVIMPVPADVTLEQVDVLKREYGDRVAQVSAPRFAEFFEMDPCETEEKHQQEWERDLSVKEGTDFMGSMQTDSSKKVAKEMLLDVEAKKKVGEYTDKFIGSAEEVKTWLKGKDYNLPTGADPSFSAYEQAGYKFLVLAVDVNLVELVGADRATLSPVRFYTKLPSKKVATRFGLPSAAPMQELLLLTMVPGKRIQVTNYQTKASPTNISIQREYEEDKGAGKRTINLKERMGELYSALHDRFLKKNPDTFLAEYAWPTSDCGKPCPTSPLLPHELLSLGADVFESQLPDDVRNPEPPAVTEEEKAKLEATLAELKTPKEKKEAKETWENDRKELAARKAMIKRNEYILSRLHYRYAASSMPKDVELGEGAPILGGVALPAGEFGAADISVKASDANQFQTRFNGLFPNITVVKCEDPKHHRWGKAPRSYRGLNKVWVAEDLARKDRERVKVDEVVMTAVPELGIPGLPTGKKVEAVPVAPQPEKKDEGFCGIQRGPAPASIAWASFGALFAAALFVRRRQARS